MSESASQPHEQAFAAFTERARDAFGDSIHELLLFGSAARGGGTRDRMDALV